MSLHSFISHIFDKKTGAKVAEVALNTLDHAVAAAKATPLGATVLSAVKEAESTTDSGPVKLAKVLGIVTPEVVSYAAKGGVTALIADAETFGKQLIESTLADLKQTGPVAIAEGLRKVFGG